MMERVYTPGRKHVDEVAEFLKVPPESLIKTMIFETDNGFVAGLVRGDQDVNPLKLKNFIGANTIELASDQKVERITKAAVGFAGPVRLPITIVVDPSVMTLHDAVCGANETDYHLIHVNPERDIPKSKVADIRLARVGETCPRCRKGTLREFRGIEVGHIFKLGVKYSEALGATFLDEKGKRQSIIMGCYGIGIGRTVAAAIEQSHDENGIIFPESIAPFTVEVLPVQTNNEDVMRFAGELYEVFRGKGIDVLLDDRDIRPGMRFKDADLIGIPLRVTIGRRFLEENVVEIFVRDTGEVMEFPKDAVVEEIEKRLAHD